MTTAQTEISLDEFERLLSSGDAVALDVREDWEWRKAHVAPAVHIPLAQIPARLQELPNDKPIAVICEHGNRSLVATHFLRARGYSATQSVSGGTAAWIRSGRPVERE